MSISTSTSAFATDMVANNSVTFASNGTVGVVWYDGTNLKFSYASSPYTSWTSLTINAASGMMVGTRLDTSNTVNTAFYISSGLDYAPVTLSGTTYTVGSLDQIASGATGGNALMGGIMEKDPQGRYWLVTTNRAGSSILVYETTTPGTAGWTSNHTVSWSSGTLNNAPAGGIVGNYLLFIYPSASSTFDYQRLDVSGVSLGSWSSATALTLGGSSPTNNNYFSFRGNSTVGIEANDSGSGIWARVYNPSTDTWASAVQLSSGASDAKPTVIAGSDGNFYVFWQSFVAANNYAIVYKKYTVASSTWDSSPTTAVASGANNFNVSGGSNNGTLGIVYQTGTASPYNINFYSMSVTSSTVVTKDITVRGRVSAQVTKDITTRGRISAQTAKDIAIRGRVGLLASKDIAVRGRIAATVPKDIVVRGRVSGIIRKDIAIRGRIKVQVTKDIVVRANVSGPRLSSGGFALMANGTGTASYDTFRVTQYPDPSILLTPVTRAAHSLVNWNANTPTNTSLTIATSIDNGVTWSNVASPGDAVPNITTQPDPTVDTFASDSSANYTSSNGTGGSTAVWTWNTINSRISVAGGSRAVLLYNGLTVTDVDLFADFKQAQNGGLIWRYSSASNYYELVVKDSANGNTYTLNKMASGTLSTLASGSIAFTTGTHHFARVTMLSGVITAYFDGVQILTYTDGSPITSGQCGLRNDTGTSLIYQLRIQPLGQDVTGIYLCEQWTLTSTDPTATPQVLDTQAFVSSANIGLGVLIPKVDYIDTYISANIDDLKKQSNYWWYVSSTKDTNGNYPLTFQDRTALPAPWPLDTQNRTFTTIDGQAIGDILLANIGVSNSADLYRNRQKVKGAIATGSFEQTFAGDGKTRTWNVANPIVSPPTGMTLNGQSVTIGVQGVDTGKDFYYQAGSTSITQDNSGTLLTADDSLAVPYVGSYVQDVIINNAISTDFPGTLCQADIAALDNSSGIVTNVVDVSGQNMTVAAATTLANQLLTRYGVIGVTFTFSTLRAGLAPGMQLTVYVPELSIDDVQMLITSVDIAPNTSIAVNGNVLWTYGITAQTGPSLGSWTKLLASGLAR